MTAFMRDADAYDRNEISPYGNGRFFEYRLPTEQGIQQADVNKEGIAGLDRKSVV